MSTIRPRNRFLALIPLLVVMAIAQAWAQSTPQGSAQAAAPSTSRLRVSEKDSQIVLTWFDSPGSTARYAIYRSSAQLNPATISGAARLGDVAPGVQTYSDTPPDSKPYYYGVFALGPDGKPFLVFTPAATVTIIPIAVTAVQPQSAPLAQPAASASMAAAPAAGSPSGAGPQPSIAGISAKPQGEGILVTYSTPPNSRLVLYRGTTKILDAADLLDAVLVAAFPDKDGSFLDYPVPGVDYYYAILGEEDLKAGRIALSEGVNSLSVPVQLPATTAAGISATPPAPRTPPLPYFLIENGVSGGVALPADEGVPPAVPVSTETEKAIASILAMAPPIQLAVPTTRILKEELSQPSGGEDYALSLIVSQKIVSKDWSGAVDQLRKYLSLNRGAQAAGRARFYLGEALSFSGSPREAFFEFLLAQDLYPAETRPWIDYELSLLQGQGS